MIVPSSSLAPEGDSSVLFTTAGMQQFKPYYLGERDAKKDFGSLNTVSAQRCVRTSDIDEVGDERHLTFFEMLGNFSFGGYWKLEAIKYAHEFVTKEMSLKIDYVTVFKGEDGVPEDTESAEIWKSIDPNIEIRKAGREDNFWGPTGEEGPCGPTTEVYVNDIEIWNIVFNEFYQNRDKSLVPLKVKGIDTGMGLERLVMVSQGVPTVFETDLFAPLIASLGDHIPMRVKRIIADHSRAIEAMIGDGVLPSNKDRGYILRRLIRRVLVYAHKYNLTIPIESEVFGEEKARFDKTLSEGLKQFEKGVIDPFILFTTYGFPFELTKELAFEKGIELNEDEFWAKFKDHQEISKAGMEQKFKGGLAGHSEMEIKYHSATHLLHQALHDVLGDEVEQRGSNITAERLRFDFSFPRKMTEEEKSEVERIVNEKIKEALPVKSIVLDKDEAIKSGARHLFNEKYPDKVTVYYIGESLDSAYSKEFCGGPHVANTAELYLPFRAKSKGGSPFKIVKEEAVSAGVRRIKAVFE